MEVGATKKFQEDEGFSGVLRAHLFEGASELGGATRHTDILIDFERESDGGGLDFLRSVDDLIRARRSGGGLTLVVLQSSQNERNSQVFREEVCVVGHASIFGISKFAVVPVIDQLSGADESTGTSGLGEGFEVSMRNRNGGSRFIPAVG